MLCSSGGYLTRWLNLASLKRGPKSPKQPPARKTRTEIECREKAHQQAIIELTAERDHARELLRQREGEAVAAENKAAHPSQKKKRLEPRGGSEGYDNERYGKLSLLRPRERVERPTQRADRCASRC